MSEETKIRYGSHCVKAEPSVPAGDSDEGAVLQRQLRRYYAGILREGGGDNGLGVVEVPGNNVQNFAFVNNFLWKGSILGGTAPAPCKG